MGNSSVGWNSFSSLKRTIEWLTSTRHTSTRHNNWITAGTRHSGVYYTDRGSDSQRSEVIQGSSARDADARNEGGMMCPSCPPPTVGQWGSWVCVCTLESTFVKYASTVSRTKGCVHSRMRRRRQTSMPTAVGISLRSGNAYCSLKDSLSSTASSLHPGNRRELLHVNETEEEEEEGKPHYLCLSLLFCLSVSVCERVRER